MQSLMNDVQISFEEEEDVNEREEKMPEKIWAKEEEGGGGVTAAF